MKIRATILIFLCVCLGFAIWSRKPHDKGLLYLRMTNYGMFGYENLGIWPKGTNEHYIFGAGVWVGGLHKLRDDTTSLSNACTAGDTVIFVYSTDGFAGTGVLSIEDELILYHSTTDTSFNGLIRGFSQTQAQGYSSATMVTEMAVKVTVGYDASSAASEFVPGDLPNEPGYPNPDERVLMTDDPQDTALWPLRDSLGNAIIRSKQDSYAIFNDQDSSYCPQPLLLKVIQVGYAWDYHYYEDFIFINYYVVNDGSDTIYHAYLSLNCDADIGDATDDLIGFDQPRDLGYAYDSDFNEPGWIHTPGYIGFDFLESPLDTLNQQIGLTAFKITHNPGTGGQGEPDPGTNLEAYQLIAGYNYTSGEYHPFDTIEQATDVRFLQCTGPFDFAPGDTVKVVVAVIAGADTSDFLANDELAQNLYNSNYLTHEITVLDPNGGEEIDGTYQVTWTDSSTTGAPLVVDVSCSRDGGATWEDVVTSIPDVHYYDWNTVDYPDGTRYLMRVTVHDTIAVGEDFSDSLFTVNNPGNGVPDVIFLAPTSGTVQDTVTVEWWANDADGDVLTIDLFAKQEGTEWDTVVVDLPNTGTYLWNTFYFHNADYYIMVVARDNDTCAVDSSLLPVTIVNDHPPAADIEHVQGGCNSLTLNCLLYDPSDITGHTYEVRFHPIEKGADPPDVYYQYDLWNVTTSTALIEHCSLGVFYDARLHRVYTPIIDGFALEFNIQIDMESFRFIDFDILENESGYDGNLFIWGADSMGTAPPMGGNQWSFRGSDFIVYWRQCVDDTTKLTLEVRDTTNCTAIAYDPLRLDSWRFEPGVASDTFNPSVHKRFYVCGGVFWFNMDGSMTVLPGDGDIWQIRSSGHRVPCNENIYRFTTTGIAELQSDDVKTFFTVYPTVFTNRTDICYTAGSKEYGVGSIKIYDISGRCVKTLLSSQSLTPKAQSLAWDGTDDHGMTLPAGVYFVRMHNEEISTVRKVILVR